VRNFDHGILRDKFFSNLIPPPQKFAVAYQDPISHEQKNPIFFGQRVFTEKISAHRWNYEG
jgi:hypothetical protein